ncbi:ROK family protein [Nocardia sp. NPDC046763]|uniref:ROK family protein n=1 Tax=Nocardia sp. NPDC046763 TaxID=3155256 RepID=UPI0033CF2135
MTRTAQRQDTTSVPTTLAIDVGGTGLKAAVLDANGDLSSEKVRVETPRPAYPDVLIAAVADLVRPLLPVDRASVGFPGMVRAGRVYSAPNLVRSRPPEDELDPGAVAAWSGFALTEALETELGVPVKVANDADMQGAAAIRGSGLEMVVTLGTGFGTALFYEGKLTPHLELAHHPFRHGESYDEQLGDETRRQIGAKKWNRRVALAVATLDALVFFDHLYIGGGNARHVTVDLGPKVTTVDNLAGILGGFRLWDCAPS